MQAEIRSSNACAADCAANDRPVYRLVALDLDGTLLNSNKQLSAGNAAALAAAAEQGIAIVPTTGRFFDGMPQVIRSLPMLRYAITINGAQVQDIQTGAVIYRAELPLEQAVQIMAYLDTLPVIYDCYADNWGWMTRGMHARAEEFAPDAHYLKMIRELRTPVDELKQHLLARGGDVQKIQLFTQQPDLRGEIAAELTRRFSGLAVSSSVPNNLEINAAGANKGDAVRALCAHLGFDIAQAVSFGDGSNDLSMIRACGLGVAMANACPEVLEAADLVTASCDDDGVARVLRAVVLR